MGRPGNRSKWVPSGKRCTIKAGFRAETGTGYASLGSHRENRLKSRTYFFKTGFFSHNNNLFG
ncbi:hypothetical protein HanHA300_Chr11g0416521 [Helianthus annuus]|nr:hypothetical protein HanHA300_Chr11g0416521 [Helianthus annuus]KAJ0518716.1 hypothetical protein HanHA89_Chr11g0440561 [Helianthus annuus]